MIKITLKDPARAQRSALCGRLREVRRRRGRTLNPKLNHDPARQLNNRIGLEVTSKEFLCAICPNLPPIAKAMLRAIGAHSIDDLFSPIPAEYRLERDLKVPRQMARVRDRRLVSRTLAARTATATPPSSAPVPMPLPAGDHRFAHLARRVSDRLHALSGGDLAGHAAGDL